MKYKKKIHLRAKRGRNGQTYKERGRKRWQNVAAICTQERERESNKNMRLYHHFLVWGGEKSLYGLGNLRDRKMWRIE
jgi:hypothetical protein